MNQNSINQNGGAAVSGFGVWLSAAIALTAKTDLKVFEWHAWPPAFSRFAGRRAVS